MEKNSIIFDPEDSYYRSPFGALRSGTELRLRLAVSRGIVVRDIFAEVKYDRHTVPAEYQLHPAGGEASPPGYDLYETSFRIYDTGLYWYTFRIRTDLGGFYGGMDPETGTGAACDQDPVPFQITVYERRYQEPDWIYGGVIYQIFPDRFNHDGPVVRLPDKVTRDDWGGVPEYRQQNGRILNNDFFGGNLRGIIEKLPYLEDLGITCIYLNPIFEAYSNHKYDTGDYMKIDPMFGTEEDFRDLCREAGDRGIRVILDGVFAHSGSDSIYFDKYGHYGGHGAWSGPDSKYRNWYFFHEDGSYDSWWGIDTLPKFNKEDSGYQNFILGEDGPVRHWLRAGAAGWRLDVADELPSDFMIKLAAAVNREKPDALLIGEVWEDASNKTAYSERKNYFEGDKLDSVMDYLVKDAIIDFIRNGDASVIDRTVRTIMQNYPSWAVNSLMNSIGTHDTPRALTALAGKKEYQGLSREEQAGIHLSPDELKEGKARLRAASLIQMTLPGVPCIYYGDEAGMEGYADPFNRGCFPWGHEDEELTSWYRKIIAIRRSHRVYRKGLYKTVKAENGCYSFIRYDGVNAPMMTVVNRRCEPVSIDIDCRAVDLLSGRKYTESITADAGGIMLLQLQKGGIMGYKENYQKWLDSGAVDDETKEELRAIAGDEDEIKDRFSEMLSFGTAGLRGVMRAGLNGMNIYTVRYATQGMADLINSCGEDIGGGVTIAYDSRNNSPEFAEEAALVLAANGIHVNIFDELRPTPELSFALRETGSIAGINITASHNPKEYNGYKAYWSDGAQLPPEHAAEVSASMNRLDIFDDVKKISREDAESRGLITVLGSEMDEKYMARVLEQSVGGKYVNEAADDLRIVYTPFHGAGYRLVPEVLKRLGIKHVIPVEEQMVTDGNFPTVKSPNPENTEGFRMAIDLAAKEDVDLIIGTDPDSDRCGVVVRNDGEYEVLTGNQIGVLLLDYLITMRRENGTLPENAAAVKSIVSTRMFNRICEANGVTPVETLTGFKFIGEKIKEFLETGEHTFIFGFEESLGFLAGTYARDKDAVLAAMLVAEMGCYYSTKGMNLYQALQSLYEKYGYYKEETIPVKFEGFDAQDKMSSKMKILREETPAEIGLKVLRVRDYLSGEVTDLADGSKAGTGLPKSDVLFYELDQDCAAVIRPSGTEPKIKIYVMASGSSRNVCEENFEKIKSSAEELLQMA